eukprot:CAMPEP_0168513586 /NCGR_PEP_ID=MMETSP0405-20121227/3563_1 /TAXON_ID=498012 /ORGANISM="Trichosphaerium sp, Strain Am-I-7 wt" /LENGTH=266 /DNA_ID=CAMNT_0008532471 /DNA_START=72 /DNA_END=868 /DNA_ORIENTATION=+
MAESKSFTKPLPKEDKADPFDRQRCIEQWNQEKLGKQVALVLGVGGLGCSVSLTLARLGIDTIILIDNDTVETSNLNRQLLFSKADVGKRKVDAAAENIKNHLAGDTKVEKYHMDVVENWDKVVGFAKRSTVVFNNVDVGESFDVAVLAMCFKLGLPYGAGSSYARTWIVEYFSGKEKESSFSYANQSGKADIYKKLTPELILTHKSLSFIESDANPETRHIGSNVLVCGSAGIMTVNAWVQSLMGFTMPNYTKFDVCTFWEPDEL